MPAHSSRVLAVAAAALLLAACGTSGPDESAGGAAAPEQPAAALHSAHGTPPPPGPLRAGERFVALTMPRPYRPAPPPRGTDEYRCFLVDPKLTAPAYLTGSQFLPQNATSCTTRSCSGWRRRDVAQARKLDADAPGDGWTCFGGTGIGGPGGRRQPGRRARRGSRPGRPAAARPCCATGTGYRMEPGSQVVMQVHYSLLALDGRPAGPDRSGVRLRLTGDGRHAAAADDAAGRRRSSCPARRGSRASCATGTARCSTSGAASASRPAPPWPGSTCCATQGGTPRAGADPVGATRPVREAGTVYAVAGHMHLLGTVDQGRAQPRHAPGPDPARRARPTTSTTRAPARWRRRCGSSAATCCG